MGITYRQKLTVLVVGMVLHSLILVACSSEPVLTVYLEANRSRLSEPAGRTSTPRQFVVEPGTPAKAIAEDLQRAGLIDDALLFEAYVRSTGIAQKLEAGTFTLSPQMTPIEIADALQHGVAPSLTVTVPEGWRLEQTADFLNNTNILDGEEYRRMATEVDLSALDPEVRRSYRFLAFHPAGTTLEGYLFPSSYEIPAEEATAADLIQRQLDQFGAQVMPVYWEAVAQGATERELHDVLTLASIVEREAVLDEERPLIAGVYLNRMDRNMKLEADPTVQYAMGFQPATGQWWKTPVSLAEYSQVHSPYNTYLYDGLPPAPIASPGLASIKAVLYPEEHDFLYFVATPDGSGRHVFSTTFTEHVQNVQRYRSGP